MNQVAADASAVGLADVEALGFVVLHLAQNENEVVDGKKEVLPQGCGGGVGARVDAGKLSRVGDQGAGGTVGSPALPEARQVRLAMPRVHAQARRRDGASAPPRAL